jgi:hypothetical protein
MRSARKPGNTVRRSVALPRRLADAALRAAPEQIRGNMNRVIRVALEEFVDRRKEPRL